MTPTQTAPATKMPWWEVLIHIFAVAAPVGAAVFSIYSKNPTSIQQAQETAQLVSSVTGALAGIPQQPAQ
jgi:hypothetical protein